jgi:hypothetical protein
VFPRARRLQAPVYILLIRCALKLVWIAQVMVTPLTAIPVPTLFESKY